jgi:hypothetical protein
MIFRRRFYECSVCGRRGDRARIDPNPHGLPMCLDSGMCYRRHQMNVAIAAMPTEDEERAQWATLATARKQALLRDIAKR